jgi:hypothetical protein
MLVAPACSKTDVDGKLQTVLKDSSLHFDVENEQAKFEGAIEHTVPARCEMVDYDCADGCNESHSSAFCFIVLVVQFDRK